MLCSRCRRASQGGYCKTCMHLYNLGRKRMIDHQNQIRLAGINDPKVYEAALLQGTTERVTTKWDPKSRRHIACKPTERWAKKPWDYISEAEELAAHVLDSSPGI